MKYGWRVEFENGAWADFWDIYTEEEVKNICKRDFENEIKEIIKLKGDDC